MGFFSRLFGGGSKRISSKSVAAGKVVFTTGREEIVMALARAAFIPPAGLAPYGTDSMNQDPAHTRIAHPSLMGLGGAVLVSGLVYPKGMALLERVEWFLARSPQDHILERAERKSLSGADVLFLHLVSRSQTPGKPDSHAVHCCFLNRVGDVTDIYCLSPMEEHARTIGDAIARTLRLI